LLHLHLLLQQQLPACLYSCLPACCRCCYLPPGLYGHLHPCCLLLLLQYPARHIGRLLSQYRLLKTPLLPLQKCLLFCLLLLLL
jgi:hypothetical protein